MRFLKALRDFAREALVGLARSLRVSLISIVTIGVSLFLASALYLVGSNLQDTIQRWRYEARFVVYLDPEIAPQQAQRIGVLVRGAPWVEKAELVPREEAELRFERTFPSLVDLIRGGANASLPPSWEARLRPVTSEEEESFRGWVRELLATEGVELVDDDRDWISEVGTMAAIVGALGLVLTGVLLGASVFTIASVVRLTSFLYRDEIAVMRLVGATEFYIRGPFYFEGLFQGLLGALLALGGLGGLHGALRPHLGDSLVAAALAGRFLSLWEVAGLLAFGALAGLVGAVLSLGREQLASAQE